MKTVAIGLTCGIGGSILGALIAAGIMKRFYQRSQAQSIHPPLSLVPILAAPTILSSFNSDIFSVENENAIELAELPLPPPPPELLSMSLFPLPAIPE